VLRAIGYGIDLISKNIIVSKDVVFDKAYMLRKCKDGASTNS
jgi:hypothetical protein